MFFRTGRFLSAAVAALALTGGLHRPRIVTEPTPRTAPPADEAPPPAPRPPLPSDEREAAAERRRVVAGLVDQASPPAPIRTFVGQNREAERRRRQAAKIAARKAVGDAQA